MIPARDHDVDVAPDVTGGLEHQLDALVRGEETEAQDDEAVAEADCAAGLAALDGLDVLDAKGDDRRAGEDTAEWRIVHNGRD